jgi:hypothetical protein
MVQGCQRFSFAVEARESIRVGSHGRGQHLYCHVPGKIGIGGSVDFTHATHTDLGTDLVRADATTWGQRQAGTGVIIRKLDVIVRLLLQNAEVTSDLGAVNRKTLRDFRE